MSTRGWRLAAVRRRAPLLGAIAASAAFTLASAGTASASLGTWERAWGGDVIEGGGTGFEVCTTASSCKAGISIGLGGEMADPRGIAVDAAGNVYVADLLNHRIQKFDSQGNFQRAWGKGVVAGGGDGFEVCTVSAACQSGIDGGLGGEMNSPFDVAVDGAGNVYVADSVNYRVQKFTSQGAFLEAWGKDVLAPNIGTDYEICTVAADCKEAPIGGLGGEMEYPLGVDPGASGIWVTDQGGQRVQLFNYQGVFQRTWGKDVLSTNVGTDFEVCTIAADCKQGTYGQLGGEMYSPEDIVEAGGAVFVTDGANARVQRFDLQGNFQRTWGKGVVAGGGDGFEVCTVAAQCGFGSGGNSGGEMSNPEGIDADAAGNLYVGENGSDRIEVFTPLGAFLRGWGKDVVLGGGTGFEICTVAANCQVGFSGPLGGEFQNPGGIALTAAGALYAVDRSNHRVQKFAAPPPPSGGPVPAKKKCKKKKRKKKGKPKGTAAAKKKCKKKRKKKR